MRLRRHHPRRRGWRTLSAAATAVLLTLTGCSGGEAIPEPTDRVVFSTGSAAGVYYAWGSALADRLSPRGIAMTVTTSSGSRENISRVQAGGATMALATQDTTVGSTGLVALARVHDDHLHVVVPADSAITELDRQGRTISENLDNPIQTYFLIGLLFSLINHSLSRLVTYVQRRLSQGGKAPATGTGRRGGRGPGRQRGLTRSPPFLADAQWGYRVRGSGAVLAVAPVSVSRECVYRLGPAVVEQVHGQTCSGGAALDRSGP